MMKWVIITLLMSVATLAQTPANPVKVYSKEGISVNSFDFNTLAPLFDPQDDNIYIINFWATWCAPCITELPAFEKVGQKYKDKKVKVVLVSLDMAKQVEKALIPFIKRKKLQSEVVHLHDPDADAWIGKISPGWSGAIPATLIVKKGSRRFYEQSFTFETLEKELTTIINN